VHIFYEIVESDESSGSMGQQLMSACANTPEQLSKPDNRRISRDTKSMTELWSGWVQMKTLRPGPTSWYRLDHRYHSSIFAKGSKSLMILRFGPDEPTAIHLKLHLFDGFWLGSHRADRKGEFVLFSGEEQMRYLSVSNLSAKKLLAALEETCRSMSRDGPLREGWLHKTSIPCADELDDAEIRSLDATSAETEIAGMFRPWKLRYCYFFHTEHERYFSYAADENMQEPKGYLALRSCSNMRTVLGESPEMVVRSGMLKERVKIFRFRVAKDADESSSERLPLHRAQMTPLELTREWAKLFSEKRNGGESKTRRRTAETSSHARKATKAHTKRPSVLQQQKQRRRTPIGGTYRSLREHRSHKATTPATASDTSSPPPPPKPTNAQRTTARAKAKDEGHRVRETERRQPKKSETSDASRIARRESVHFRKLVKDWARGKDILALIHDVPELLPPTSAQTKRAADAIIATSRAYLDRGRCSTMELKKLYRKSVRYCHPDKWAQANQGDVRSKILCSEAFRIVQSRYEMMAKVFAESGETEYIV